MPTAITAHSESEEPHDIAAVVSRHVALEPHADHRLHGAYPLCGSPASACIFRPAHDTFHCLSCGEGGDPKQFLAKLPR